MGTLDYNPYQWIPTIRRITMSNIGDGFKNIFLAGIGAMAYTGEKGKELIDQLVAKGEITLEQSKELNEELQRKATETTQSLRDGVLEASMRTMTPEERDEFVATATRIAAEQNAAAEPVQAEIVEDVSIPEAEQAEEPEAEAKPEPEEGEQA